MMADLDESNEETSFKVFEKYCIARAPAAVYYIPDFVTAEEENRLWHCIYTAPKPKWTVLTNRRLQNWGGLPHSKGMVPEPLPQWLSQFTDRVSALGVFGDSRTANHVLVNEYTPGQGIMAHVDGPLFYPTINTISIGGHTLLNLYSMPEKSAADAKNLMERFLGSLLLEPRSLLILQQDAYTATLHDIANTDTDLVCRDRVLNWDQTVLGRWAMRSSQLVVNDKCKGGTEPVCDATPCGEKGCESPDCSQNERYRRKDTDADKSPSVGNIEASKVNVGLKDQQTNNGNDRLVLGSKESEIRNGEKEAVLSALDERGIPDLVNYLHKRFNIETNTVGIRNKVSNIDGSSNKTNTECSSAVDGSVEVSVPTSDEVERKYAMYALEIKLAGCESPLINNKCPKGSDETEPSISQNTPAKSLDTLTEDHCTTGNEITKGKGDPQVDHINSLEILGDQSPLEASKGCHCYKTPPPKEVCQSLAGPGHSGAAVPAVQAVTVAGKQCFSLSRGTRISLTIRHVPKVIKTKIFLGRR